VKRYLLAATAALTVAACHKDAAAPMYEMVPVQRRDIVVTASAAGTIQPILTVQVKSQASGAITEMRVQTGDDVRPGQLLALIDPRLPKSGLDQAKATLEVAKAQFQNAQTQLARTDTLLKTQAVTQTDYDNARLAFTQAQAALVNARSNLSDAQIAYDQTRVTAPVSGTIIQKNVEQGMVISSPARDVASAAHVLGLDPNDVQAQLAAAPAAPPTRFAGDTAQHGGATLGAAPAAGDPRPAGRDTTKAATNVMTTPDGRQITLPTGYTAEKIRDLFRKSMGGEQLTPAEQAAMSQVRSQFMTGRGGQGGGGGFPSGQMRRGGAFASSYIVFALRNGKATPVNIRTGLTDLDYIEVTSGLTEKDTVLLLPSASLVQAQQDMRNRFQSMTGGGLPGLRQQTPGATGATTTRSR